MAEGVRFELTRPLGLPVFKTGAINRSATPPENVIVIRLRQGYGGQVGESGPIIAALL